MTNSLADRIENALVEKEDVTLHYVTPRAARQPISAAKLDAIEKAIDAPLPPVIRDFYLGVRELGLAWSEGGGGARPMAGRLDWNALADESFWRRAGATPGTRGAMINIPPADVVFQKGYWLDRIVNEPQGDEIKLDGRTLSDEIYNDLYPFDFFCDYYVVGLWYDRPNRIWRAVLGEDHGASWTDYRTLDVAEYMAQLERGLGGPREWVGQGTDDVRTIWAVESAPEPESDGAHPDHPGFPMSVEAREINEASAPFCRAFAESMPALTSDELAAAVRRHADFVAKGELYEGWECCGWGHFPVNIYRGLNDENFPTFERVIMNLQPEIDALGEHWDAARAARLMGAFRDAEVVLLYQGQLSLGGRWLAPGANLASADLRAANLAGSICERVEFRKAQLAGSNAVDGFFDGASFAEANLDGVDFSRSSMRGCDFRGASLAGTDFEKVDLTGAIFTDADTSIARFPGAVLTGVVR